MSFLAFHYANDILYTMTMTMRWWWYKGEAQSLSADMTKREREDKKRALYCMWHYMCFNFFKHKKGKCWLRFFCSSLSKKINLLFKEEEEDILLHTLKLDHTATSTWNDFHKKKPNWSRKVKTFHKNPRKKLNCHHENCP